MSKYILLENGFKGYVTTGYWNDTYTCIPKVKKVRPDNRKYAYIFTKKGRVLATVDPYTLKAYKVEGCYRKTWTPIKKFIFDKWVSYLNW